MFTGLIQAVGEIGDYEVRGGDVRLRVDCSDFDLSKYAEGESIAVSGVCLTAVGITTKHFYADVSKETLDNTTLGEWRPGRRVNLEPSMALGDRLGGHLVTGHVDAFARITAIIADARSSRISLEIPSPLQRFVARKGSVAVDGISLTVNSVEAPGCHVNIIPHTWDHTTLQDVKVGAHVNIEVDLMARYVERFLDAGDKTAGIDRPFLEKHGYER